MTNSKVSTWYPSFGLGREFNASSPFVDTVPHESNTGRSIHNDPETAAIYVAPYSNPARAVSHALFASYNARTGLGKTILYRDKPRYPTGSIGDGLVAIVAPVCCGKSTLAETFGGYDADELVGYVESAVPGDLEVEEMEEKRDQLLCGKANDHNEMVLRRLARALTYLQQDDNIKVLYLHTVEQAYKLNIPILHVYAVDCFRETQRFQNSSSNDQFILERTWQDLHSSNVEFCKRRKINAPVVYNSYTQMAHEIKYRLTATELLKPHHASVEIVSKIGDGTATMDNGFELVTKVLKDPYALPSQKAVCARWMQSLVQDCAMFEANAAHNHSKWARVLHFVYSNVEFPINEFASTAQVISCCDEAFVEEHFPYAAQSPAFAGMHASTFIRDHVKSISSGVNYRSVSRLIRGVLSHNLFCSYEKLLSHIMFEMGLVHTDWGMRIADLYYRFPLGCLNVKNFAVATKLIHQYTRTSGTWVGKRLNDQQLSILMYPDCLMGRVMSTNQDELLEAEIADRTNETDSKKFCVDGVWSKEVFDVMFSRELDQAYISVFANVKNKLKKLTPHVASLREFLNRRKSWSKPGSTTGAPKFKVKMSTPALEDVQTRLDGIDDVAHGLGEVLVEVVLRLNKATLFEFKEFPDLVMTILAEYEPNSQTGIFWKHEFGKPDNRALFPSNVIHYIVISMVLYIVDQCGQFPNSRQNSSQFQEREDHVLWRHLTDFVASMLDYKNFNEQHSIEAMQMVIGKLEHFYRMGGVLSDSLKFMIRWATEAFEHIDLKVKDGASDVLIRFIHGLLSGWRCTSFVNSVINVAQASVGRRQLQMLFGRSVATRFQTGGDDGEFDHLTTLDAYILLAAMTQMGFGFSDIKQMMSYTVREFYRLLITPSGVYGSLCRMIGSVASGQWSNSVRASLVEEVAKATSIVDITRKLYRRSGHEQYYCTQVQKYMLAKWLGVDNITHAEQFLHGSKSSGGLGIPMLDGRLYELEGVEHKPLREPRKFLNLPNDASTHMIAELVDEAKLLVGENGVHPVKHLAEKMSEMIFVGNLAQHHGPSEAAKSISSMSLRRVRVKGVKRVLSLPKAKPIPIGETIKLLTLYHEEINILLRIQARVSVLECIVKSDAMEKLKEKLIDTSGSRYPRRIALALTNHELYGLGPILTTEAWYASLLALSYLTATAAHGDHVSLKFADYATGVALGGYMGY